MATLTLASLPVLSFAGYPALWTGDTATGDASASPALQAAIDDCDGVLDLAPGATYLIDDAVTLKSRLHIRGNGATLLQHASCTDMLRYLSDDLTDLTIEGLRFDGSATWPEDETSDKWDLTPTYGIRISGADARRLKILDCYFEKISGSSISITSIGGEGLWIERCALLRGFYFSKGISVYADNGSSEASRFKGIKISGCRLQHGGPTAYVDAADEIYINSSDGIHVDGCANVIISDNDIEYPAGDAIRVEQTVRCSVSNNKIFEPGYNGINFYESCEDISATGNKIENWGRLPYAGALYDYNDGTLVIPREFPHATLAQFPADPTVSSWWEVWPYTTTGIDTETIRDYADKAYYSGVNTGSLPFRGFYGIGVVHNSKNAIITGNTCIPDLTTDGGKYTHASDFGIASTHYINAPVDSSTKKLGIILGNVAAGRVEDVYTPDYDDPINERGPKGARVVENNTTP